MYVDVNRGSDKLKVSIDINVNRIPCDILAILTSDNLGEKTIDNNGVITQSRCNAANILLDYILIFGC